MPSIANLTFDCADPQKVAAFWSACLDLTIADGASPFFVSARGADGPNFFFIAVPETKTVKNRLHLDLETEDRESEVVRLVELGATKVSDKAEWGHEWTIMADPEGNEFCVSGPHHTHG